MKKLLLVVPFAAALTACGSNTAEEVAYDYCIAVKQMNWDTARELASPEIVDNRENMFEQNMGKYSQLFASQNCNVTKIDTHNEHSHSIYFGGSKIDSVEIEWDEKEEEFFVASDAFKNDLKLY